MFIYLPVVYFSGLVDRINRIWTRPDANRPDVGFSTTHTPRRRSRKVERRRHCGRRANTTAAAGLDTPSSPSHSPPEPPRARRYLDTTAITGFPRYIPPRWRRPPTPEPSPQQQQQPPTFGRRGSVTVSLDGGSGSGAENRKRREKSGTTNR